MRIFSIYISVQSYSVRLYVLLKSLFFHNVNYEFCYEGPSFGSSFSMGSGYYGSGFSYDGVGIPYSASNTSRILGYPNIAPPNSYSFPRFPMTDDFYYASGFILDVILFSLTCQALKTCVLIYFSMVIPRILRVSFMCRFAMQLHGTTNNFPVRTPAPK